MKAFKDTKVAKILKASWAGKDMERYFVEKSKEFKELLIKNKC